LFPENREKNTWKKVKKIGKSGKKSENKVEKK
jgi:hypothetical protein